MSSDRGFNKMPWGHADETLNEVVREEAVLGKYSWKRGRLCWIQSYEGITWAKGIPGKGHTACMMTWKGRMVPSVENYKEFHIAGAYGVKGQWDCKGIGRVLRRTFKVRLKEFTFYLDNEGNPLKDFFFFDWAGQVPLVVTLALWKWCESGGQGR